MAAIRGDRLKHLRQSMGLNQTQLADKLGIKSYQISKYERETDNPSVESLMLLAEFFNTTIDYLVGLSNVPHREAEPEPDISAEERELLNLFADRTREERRRALHVLRALWEKL